MLKYVELASGPKKKKNAPQIVIKSEGKLLIGSSSWGWSTGTFPLLNLHDNVHCNLHYNLHYNLHSVTTYITLPCIAFQSITFHYITFHYITTYITLHCNVHCITLQLSLHYITLHYITFHLSLPYLTLHFVTLQYIILHTCIWIHELIKYFTNLKSSPTLLMLPNLHLHHSGVAVTSFFWSSSVSMW